MALDQGFLAEPESSEIKANNSSVRKLASAIMPQGFPGRTERQIAGGWAQPSSRYETSTAGVACMEAITEGGGAGVRCPDFP